jgi:multidrug efflux pump subunit AcrA (membrane-fusion protein)
MAAKKTLKLLATVYNQPHPDHPDDPNRLIPRSEGETFEANSQEEYDRLIDIGAALDPDEAQKQEKAQLDERLAALDAEKAQLDDRRKAIQAEAKSSQAKG